MFGSIPLLLPERIKYSESYFFEDRGQAPSQFCIKEFSSQPFVTEISAEIHLAVRKQVLFGKDVLNVLPPSD